MPNLSLWHPRRETKQARDYYRRGDYCRCCSICYSYLDCFPCYNISSIVIFKPCIHICETKSGHHDLPLCIIWEFSLLLVPLYFSLCSFRDANFLYNYTFQPLSGLICYFNDCCIEHGQQRMNIPLSLYLAISQLTEPPPKSQIQAICCSVASVDCRPIKLIDVSVFH
jgi:hypothetical protein